MQQPDPTLTIQHLAARIANLEIENAQLKAVIQAAEQQKGDEK